MILGALIILAITILAVLYAPPEGEANNVTGDLPETPTVVAINELSVLPIQQSITLGGLQISIKRATLASSFSDDLKRAGTYTLRVLVDTQNKTNSAVGYPFADNVHLLLPNGQSVDTKLISVMAASLPQQAQSGYFDFPIAQPIPLNQLALQFAGNNNTPIIVPFSNT